MTRDEQEACCLAITGSFEGAGFGAISGNFDGQGMSLGVLQWPLGQGNAQRLIDRIHALDIGAFVAILGTDKANRLMAVIRLPIAHAVAWGDSLSLPPGKQRITTDWAVPLRALLVSPTGQRAQRELARPYLDDARADAEFYGLETLRGLALCFDVAVQSGTGKAGAGGKADVAREFAARGGHALPYPRKLRALAEAVAATCNPRWRADVLGRKGLICAGVGRFRGALVDLGATFGLSDAPLV